MHLCKCINNESTKLLLAVANPNYANPGWLRHCADSLKKTENDLV